MKLLAMVHGFPPIHNAGAEWMLYEMLKHLTNKGHECVIMVSGEAVKEDYIFNGIRVRRDVFEDRKTELMDTDVMLSHLDRNGKALNVAEFYGKPFIHLVHNTNHYAGIAEKNRPTPKERFLYVIYNSEYTRNALKYPNPSIIVHPPVAEERVKTKRGEKITLINLWEDKGGLVLQEIAKLMPDKKFLGVKGGYGEQELSKIKNIEYIENTPDIKKVYSKTRILLMPSKYESYGRTAVEAMASGIPVIAHITPGLVESLGDAGIFCNRDNPQEWVNAINKLDDEKEYKAASKRALDRFAEISKQTATELEAFEEFLIKVIDKNL